MSTGTLILGASPVGSRLIVLDRDDIDASGAQSVQQLLRFVPSVTGFGNAAQGAYGSADGSGTFAPTIHGLGASASNGTLVLVDGHRLPLTGINHALADPDVIAPLAIERIELLADGASATYGTDAVAGVINVITRSGFDGFAASARSGIANHYHSYSGEALWGMKFESGSLLFNYSFEFRSHLLASTRSFARADHTLLDPEAGIEGGSAGNFATNNCSPATVTTTAGTFAYPYTGAAITSGRCDFTGLVDLLPETRRHNVLIKGSYEINEALTLSGDVVWSRQDNLARINRGSVAGIRAWGAGSSAAAGQVNPFFTGPPGVASETVNWQADDLLGSGATNQGGAVAFFTTLGLDYRTASNWLVSINSTIGSDDSRLRRDGALCGSCAILALNGTTRADGDTSLPSSPGVAAPVLQALTPATALDVWNSAANNRTSAAVRAQLLDSLRVQRAHHALAAVSGQIEGALLSLPGGPLRAVVGAEYLKSTMSQDQLLPGTTGPASTNSSSFSRTYARDATSLYAELLLPLVDARHGHPGLRRLDLSLSGRFDRLSDMGSSTSPRFAFSWDPKQGVTVRGTVSHSFTAPALSIRGDANGISADSAVSTLRSGTNDTGSLTLPSSYPGVAQLQALNLPGCTRGSSTCLLGNNSVSGLQIAGGNRNLKEAAGRNLSVGFDLAPGILPHFQLSATYWSASYEGAIAIPAAGYIAASPNLGVQALTIYPNGASAAQIASVTAGMRQTQLPPATTYFVLSAQPQNALNLNATGVDVDLRYQLTTRLGLFHAGLSASRKLKLDQKFGSDGLSFSTLNTVGVNAAFPSNRLAGRVDVGLKRAATQVSVDINYEGFYRNWGTTAGAGNAAWNVIRLNGLYPIGGGEPVESYTTIDLHARYSASFAWARGLVLSLDATNLFDNRPPFLNTIVGYDALSASPIDRLLSVGLSGHW